jgi:FkbM family methyltransferase
MENKKVKVGNLSFNVSKDCFPKGIKKSFASWWFIGYWDRVEKEKWEPQTFEIFDKFLDKEHSYIDIGAWIGPTVLYGCQLAKQCYAIEPDPIALEKLKENINLNPKLKKKISIYEGCISNKKGYTYLGNIRDFFGNSMSGILFKNSKKLLRVKSTRLEDFIKKNKISDLNFIKIDIEGGETIVLPDIKEYLKKNKPTIHLSLHPYWFKNLEKDSRAITDSIKEYKNHFNDVGEKMALEEIYNKLINKEGFDIVVTDKEWKI